MQENTCLNPCCNGMLWLLYFTIMNEYEKSLNPCCNGMLWLFTHETEIGKMTVVLILVVMESLGSFCEV